VKQATTNKVEAQRTKEKIRSENTRFTRVANWTNSGRRCITL